MNPQQLFDQARQFHQQGDLAAAERLYRQVIAQAPAHFAPRHLLGILHAQQGHHAEALEWIDSALRIEPANTMALSNRGNVFKAAGRPAEALTEYDKALARDPALVETLDNRGTVLREMGRPEEAAASYDRALALKPDHLPALYNRATLLWQTRRPNEALAAFDALLARQPGMLPVLHARGCVLRELGRPGEALASFDRALAIRPDYIEALYDCASTLWTLRRFEDALAGYQAVLTLRPNFAEAHAGCALALWNLRRLDGALAAYDQALALLPGLAPAWSGRGSVLWELGRLEEAVVNLDRALALQPDLVEALNSRGNVMVYLNRLEEAARDYEKALAVVPDHPFALGGLATAALHLCDWPRTARIARAIAADPDAMVIPPVTLLGYSGDGALLRRCAERNVRERVPAPPPSLAPAAPYRHDKIRIAYLSPDFGRHPVAFQMAELFERHDRARFEVAAISTGPDDGSEMRVRLTQAFDQFHDVQSKSDRAVAELVRALETDILIDLGGHTRAARLEILSHRPAPVQATYLGYAGTTGADFVDYLIADAVTVPTAHQLHFSEHIVHLPGSFFATDSRRRVGEPPTRAQAGLPETGFVFCCFNKNWKITAPLFDVWMRLLDGVPDSVLWLKNDGEETMRRLQGEATARGVDPARLIFAERVESEAAHLARHRLADLFLDTLIYNAHATACDALWAGLPLVTCRGESFAGRVSASLLTAAALPELVTENLGDYEALALALARDGVRLEALRRRLEENRRIQPLFDGDHLRRHLEAAYARMVESHERGEAPAPFAV